MRPKGYFIGLDVNAIAESGFLHITKKQGKQHERNINRPAYLQTGAE